MPDQPTKGDKVALALIKCQGKYYLELARDGNISACLTVQEYVDVFEHAYNEGHQRGPTWSTGATLFWMMFQPSIIFASLDEITPMLLPDPRHIQKRSEGGSMHLTELVSELAEPLWENGTKPRLISEKTEHHVPVCTDYPQNA